MELWHILVLIFGHTVADFVFQTDEVAKGKSSDNGILFKHVATYICCLTLFASSIVVSTTPMLNFLGFLAINFAAHFITDYITSRLTTYFWKREDRHNFFVTIGFDQFAHLAVLLITYSALLV